jgi:hypothetical protein
MKSSLRMTSEGLTPEGKTDDEWLPFKQVLTSGAEKLQASPASPATSVSEVACFEGRGGQKAEGRKQKAESRKQKAESRKQKAESRKQNLNR